MPKSRRNKVVSLTKTKKKGRDAKENMVKQVQDALKKFAHCYVLSFENLRTGPFKKMQHQLKDTSRFFFGKNKVMQLALGRTPEEEEADNAH